MKLPIEVNHVDSLFHIRVKVIPRSAKTEYVGTLSDGSLKIRLKAVPENGKANAELVRFLSEEFGLPERCFEVISGVTDSRKLVRVRRDIS